MYTKPTKIMKNALPRFLFYYCFLASILVVVSSAISAKKIEETIFSFMFLPVGAYFITEFFFKIKNPLGKKENTPLNRGSIITSIIFLIILFSISLYNVNRNQSVKGKKENVLESEPLIFQTEEKPSPTPVYKKVTVKISDGSETVNIRQKPTIYSEVIGEAKNNDIFNSYEKTGEWYKIILNEQETGYISFKYIEEEK